MDAAQPRPDSTASHIRAMAVIAAPIALALLGQMAMGLTDMIMLGRIGANALAAGGLGANLFFTCLFTLQGALSGVPVLAARFRGAGQHDQIPATYWSGILIAACLAGPYFWLMSSPEGLLRLLHEPPRLSADLTAYIHVLRWGVPAGLIGFGAVRGFLPAVELQHLTLWVLPGTILLNLLLNIWFIHGGLGLPAYGMLGSAAATATSMWVGALSVAALLHLPARWRHHVRLSLPNLGLVRELLLIGLPVSGTVLVEAALFLATGFVLGILGPVTLAAHTVALNVASVSFMVPLAIAQAAQVRVSYELGRGDPSSARRAGFVAIGMAACFMGCSALVMETAPGFIASLYLGASSAALPVATSLLRIAGVFQLVDGIQATASGSLRGLKDTRIPMLLAALGYWGIGFWSGRFLAFSAGMGAVGLWWGLCAGLATSAVLLTARFARRSTSPQFLRSATAIP